MRVVTADETGLIKVIAVETREVLAVGGLEQQSRERCVKALCWGHSSSAAADYSCLHVGRDDGVVESWSLAHTASRGSKVRGTAALNTSAAAARPGFPKGLTSLAAVSGLGSDATAAVVAGVSAAGEVHISSSSGSDKGTTFSTGGPVNATSWRGASLATGGKEHDVQLWDLSTQQCTWRAKNVPMDYKLQLRIPVWVTAVAPLHSTEQDPLQQQLIAGTAHKHVRLYDARAHRRPVKSLDYGEYRITALVVAAGGREALIADAAGEVTCLDLRTFRRRRRYSGGGGSTRCLALHPSLPVFAAVGLDRMCRVYDIDSSSSSSTSSSSSGHTEPLHSIYLKQRANRVLFCEEGRVSVPGAGGSDAPDGADVSSDAEEEEAGWGSGEEYDMFAAGAASGSDDSGADDSADDDQGSHGSDNSDSEAEDDTAVSTAAAAAANAADSASDSGSDSGSDDNATTAAAADHDGSSSSGSGSDSGESETEEQEEDAAAVTAQRRARAAAAAAQSSSNSRQRRQQSGDAPAAKAPASKRFKRTK
jgi:WD40 repeat protein